VKALVAGGAGFIGSHLVDRLLAEGHTVDVVDDLSSGSLSNLAEARAQRTGRLKIHQVDVRDDGVGDLVVQRAPEVVFLLAAPRDDDVDDTRAVADAEVTVVGGLRLLDAARRGGARKVVFASTGAIYGSVHFDDLPVRESHAQHPSRPRGVAAKALTDYLASYRERFDLEYTAVALAEVYGPRQTAGLVPGLAADLRAGRTPSLELAATRDLVFVDDVVDALVRAVERGGGLLVNVGSGVETPLVDLFGLLAARLGVDVAVGSRRRGAPADRLALDRGRARIQLGWEPWTSLDDGLALTLADATSV
jgi:UDP-glucose 4-epimerase